MQSTTFVDEGYDFTVADGYNLTQTVSGAPLSIRVRNDNAIGPAQRQVWAICGVQRLP